MDKKRIKFLEKLQQTPLFIRKALFWFVVIAVAFFFFYVFLFVTARRFEGLKRFEPSQNQRPAIPAFEFEVPEPDFNLDDIDLDDFDWDEIEAAHQ